MTTRRGMILASVAGVCILVPLLMGIRKPARRTVPERPLNLDGTRAAVPFLFIYMYPKYPLPGEPVIGGLKVAIWQDGRVVRARSAAEVGKSYVEGRLSPEQTDRLIRSIERTGILATPSDESAPLHEASDLLKIRTRGKLQAWSHSVPNKENPLVKQLEEVLMTIEVPDAAATRWEAPYPSDWDK